MSNLARCTRPTLYFVGVTTGSSSIQRIFPQWMRILGLDAALVGYDVPLGAAEADYVAIVEHIKRDPLACGALVTTHKIDLLNATRGLFDWLEPDAVLCGEVACLSKRHGQLRGHAKDTTTSALAWQAFVLPGHWARRSRAQVLCLGAGGAATAISVAVARFDEAKQPRKFTVVDQDAQRLDRLRGVHERMGATLPFAYVLNDDARANDALMGDLPDGSMVINATGLGKDRPGSPVTNDAPWPQDGLVWELNYRGALDFLQQARNQAAARNLTVEDGWTYFLNGWVQVIAEVFDLTITPAQFAELDAAAAELR